MSKLFFAVIIFFFLFGFVFSTTPIFKDGVSVGNLPSNAQWQEVSGMTGPTIAANANYLWMQSDGSEDKILAVLKTDASTTYEWTLDGVTVNDCEDMASAKINDISYLYVAQIGDNSNVHDTSTIYRFPEPIIIESDSNIASETIEHIIVEFPADHMPTHKDAETFLVDPDTGDMYIITKREEIPSVYHLAHQASYTGTQTLVYDGNMWAIPAKTSVAAAGAAPNAVGGNISPDGTEIIIKNYDQVFYWNRSDKGVSIYETLTQTPTELVAYVGGGSNTPRKSHPSAEPQGEAITWDYNGENFYTGGEYVAAEGSTPTQYPLFMYERMYDTETTVYFQDGNNGYSGTLDTYIWDTNPDTSYGTLTTLVADTGIETEEAQRKVLLKFDLSSVPSTATIIGATLYLYINTEGQGWKFHRMLIDWNEESTYNSLVSGVDNDGVDAAVAEDNRNGFNLNGFTGTVRNNMSLPTIQGWVDGTYTNYGWLIEATDLATGDGQQYDSREGATVSRHPQLVLRYTTKAPDLNITYPLTQSYNKNSNPTIDVNINVLDLDTNANGILIDLNYSLSQTQGTGTSIISGENLATTLTCDSNDLASARNCNYRFDISALSEGTYYILTSITDGTDTTFKAAETSFIIDETSPNVVADYNLNWQNATQNVSLACADSLSGCLATYYRIDSDATSTVSYGAWQTYSSAISFATDGNYALDFNAIDNAGLWDDTNTIYILIDKTNPTTIMNTPTGWQTTSVDVTLLSATDALSGINITQYRIDSDETSGVTMGSWQTFDQNVLFNIDGNFAFDFNSSDTAGNLEDTNRIFILIDTTTPNVIADYNSGWQRTDENVELTCSDASSGCLETYYRLDTDATNEISYGAWQTYTSAIEFTTDGNYALDFNATDNVDLWDDTNTIYILIDKTVPTLTTTPDANLVTISSSYLISFLGTDVLSGLQGYFVSTDNTNFTLTTDTNYTLSGSDGDTNTLYVKSTDNADNNSATTNISIIFSSGTDTDGDSIPDTNDTLDGNSGNIITTGFSGNTSITVGNTTGNGSFSGLKSVTITNADNNVVSFNHNFSTTDLNMNKIQLIKTSTSLIVKLSEQLQSDQNKTIYIEDNSFIGLCIKDSDINDIVEISSTCTDTNEYNFTGCLNGSLDINGIICTDLGSTIRIENLRHSAVVGTLATATTNTPSTGGSCIPYWSCNAWSNCIDGNQTRTCTKLNNCGTLLQGKPTEIQSCIVQETTTEKDDSADNIQTNNNPQENNNTNQIIDNISSENEFTETNNTEQSEITQINELTLVATGTAIVIIIIIVIIILKNISKPKKKQNKKLHY